jgi:hypothetical protein
MAIRVGIITIDGRDVGEITFTYGAPPIAEAPPMAGVADPGAHGAIGHAAQGHRAAREVHEAHRHAGHRHGAGHYPRGEDRAAAPSDSALGEPLSGGAAYLAARRAPFKKELDEHPETKRLLGAIVSAENPGAGPGVAESLMNRTELVNEARARRGEPPLTLHDMIVGHPSIGGGQ